MEIVLGKSEKYAAKDVVTFRKLNDRYGSLSNMSREYGIELFDTQFIASEMLYIAAGFRDEAIQRELLKHSNPTGAKRIFRHGVYLEQHWRKDWEQFNVEWMKYCIMLKYRQNPLWVALLNSTKGKMILEDSSMQTSTTSLFWGAKDTLKAKMVKAERRRLKKLGNMNKTQIKRQMDELYPTIVGNGYYEGCNTMGKLLTMLRDNSGILHCDLPDDIYILGNKVVAYV
ncbi:MAG: NADAR family protein [Candidatus Symbiothrix sp.]|jgi:predicted NAD-dependent protein-ADP-ribosyltransferase YbiA (DUF1768 family)|nr:NADAR family protein [Candidatus Symbiothrix sp.]